MEIANIHDAKSRLSKLVEQAMRGEEVVIAKAGTPVVRLVPIQVDTSPRWEDNGRAGSRWPTTSIRCRTTSPKRWNGIQMTLLLDTHVFLWWLDDPGLLSKPARKAVGDGKNTVYLSAAVVWEISIKKALGKLDAPDDVEAAMTANRFLPLPVTVPHALAVQSLPDLHRDPFDRLLIAQAKHEGFKLVSRDANVPLYGVAHIVA